MAGPDIKNFEPSPVPVPGDEKPAPEPDTKNLDALLASLNGSAERFQTLWFSFLGLTLYLAIAALATTHRNLLLGEPQTLPILNIKVELLPFCVIAPLLYLVFHFYLLMMLVLLARTAAEFESELRKTLPYDIQQERYRARIKNALFLQLLVGMKRERSGVNGVLLGFIALITIVLAPLTTLILMQMMFLPYHSLGITWLHRSMVAIDVSLIIVGWTLFFKYSGAMSPLLPFRAWPRMRFAARGLVSLALIAFAFWLSGWEGRWAGEPWVGRPNVEQYGHSFNATRQGVVFGLFPDRLVLPDEIIVGKDRFEETQKEIASRAPSATGTTDPLPTRRFDNRDLEGANLTGADLRGVSLTGARMQGTDLGAARLDGAKLDNTQLQNANLFVTQLQGASLTGAQLQSVDLQWAQLQGANLGTANLHGVILAGAKPQGANLGGAELSNADLGKAMMQGTHLFGAQLQGATLDGANLEGADLLNAQLQGANLRKAHLRGANLTKAQLQGADLTDAEAPDAKFDATLVFRANIARAKLDLSVIQSLRTDMVKFAEWRRFSIRSRFRRGISIQPLTQADVVRWIAKSTKSVKVDYHAEIAKQFDRLNPNFQTVAEDAVDQALWKGLEEAYRLRDPDGVQHRRRLVTIFGDLACNGDGAPYVARALLSPNYPLNDLREQFERLRDRLKAGRKTPDACPGVAGFTDEDWRRLEAIKPD